VAGEKPAIPPRKLDPRIGVPLRTILNSGQKELLESERDLFHKLVAVLTRAEIVPTDMEMLFRSIIQLDELFLLVVVGEFNSGKSAFINALLGQSLLKEGVTPTTQEIQVLRFGAEPRQETKEDSVVYLSQPLPMLQEINIVDTPGTNAVIREHEQITQDFVPRSDLVMFVTSADRPFTESERVFLDQIRQWGKKVLLVINKIDLLDDQAIQIVESYVRDNSTRLLGFTPEVFPLSARLALQAKIQTDPTDTEAMWQASRFEDLERYIFQTLDEQHRIQLKLLSPLGVADRIVKQYAGIVEERLSTLAEDFLTVQNIELQLTAYRQDMLHDYAYRVSDIENHLLSMESRGLTFFDDTLRLPRIFDLINSQRIRGSFEREVVGDTPRQIEAAVNDTIDWFVERDLRQWQAIMDYLVKRRTADHHDRLIGQITSPFEYNRRALLESVGKAAGEAVASYDKAAEAKALGEATQLAVAQAALLEVGAVGLGTLVTLAVASTVADVSGIMAATVMAALGFFVIPSKRRKAKAELQGKIADVRQRLVSGLTKEFEDELDRTLQRMREAMAPYTRFVRAEGDRLRQVQKDLVELQRLIETLKYRIERS
jgi:small GTP-binding protein